jgi:rhamnose transport system permease protein
MSLIAAQYTSIKLSRYKREISAALAYAALLVLVGLLAPGFFSTANWRDLAMQNAPVLMVAIGMTMVILAGHIDISVGSQFAVCSVAAGVVAKAGVPMPLLVLSAVAIGGLLGATNGALVARFKIPAIVVTLATLVAWRDGLRWVTEGAWVQNLPANFQWFGLGQATGQVLIVAISLGIFSAFAWLLGNLAAGRAIYAVGSDAEAARLAGIEPPRVVFSVFILMGAMTGLAAVLNAVRFAEVPSNAGVGLELKAIAAVVVGGTSIFGGRGTVLGTVLGLLAIVILQNGLRLSAQPAELAGILTGVLLIATTLLDHFSARIANVGRTVSSHVFSLSAHRECRANCQFALH